MPIPIIEVENLTKKYRIGAQREPYLCLREELVKQARLLAKRLSFMASRRNDTTTSRHDFFALQEVSFDIQEGEVVGIIGRNGAGKSTLLKILSKITPPTKGRVVMRGRVASLLEVGTGFHPELTGRENIFLNGAILGMSKSEIRNKFDEIVAFAEVEKFLDTPVKRYSSGMYVRLAFAVAAHLEPEILLVDEVLAVGDVQFQKKCLGKMGEIAGTGRTIIFISHSMPAIERLTRFCLVLDQGRLTYAGETKKAVEQYLKAMQIQTATSNDVRNKPRPSFPMDQRIVFRELFFDHLLPIFTPKECIPLMAKVYAKEHVSDFRFSGTIFQASGTAVGSFFSPCNLSIDGNEEVQFAIELSDNQLAPGRYYFGLAVGTGNVSTGHTDSDILLEVLPFEIKPLDGDAGTMGRWASAWGAVMLREPTVRRV